MEYPEHLHDTHDQFPLAPEKLEVVHEDLSEYSQKLFAKFYPMRRGRFSEEKLLTTLENKDKYVVHAANLKLYLRLGLVLKKIHRVISFKQKKFLKNFINFVTRLRSEATTSFEITLYKLVANATFGKFIEDCLKYLKTTIVERGSDLQKLISQKSFKSFTIINENMVAVHSVPKEAKMNKAYSVGFTILEYAKFIMYVYLYRIILPECPSFRILMHDTDSFLGYVKDMSSISFHKKLRKHFDFSKYDKSHKLYDPTKKNALFLLKDELQGKEKITEFVGLRSKCYAYKSVQEKNRKKESKTCKGIKKKFIRKDITFDMYKTALQKEKLFRTQVVNIQSREHLLRTVKQTKISLSSFDSKRYLLDCGTHSYAYGNYRIKKSKGKCKHC